MGAALAVSAYENKKARDQAKKTAVQQLSYRPKEESAIRTGFNSETLYNLPTYEEVKVMNVMSVPDERDVTVDVKDVRDFDEKHDEHDVEEDEWMTAVDDRGAYVAADGDRAGSVGGNAAVTLIGKLMEHWEAKQQHKLEKAAARKEKFESWCAKKAEKKAERRARGGCCC